MTQALGTEVESSQPILFQLEDVVHQFNEDIDGQYKLLKRVEKKFENKVLEQISQKITIYQVELSTSLSSLESTYSNVTLLFKKLCDSSIFTKDIKEKLSKIDKGSKESA